MSTMKKMVQVIACFSLCFLQGYGEEHCNPADVTTVKSQKSDTGKEKEEKASLGAFEKLHWETDMDVAFERAKKERKNVMVMIEEADCKWCMKMKKGALSDPKVQDRLQSYILLKVKRSDKKTADRIEDFTGAIPSFYFMQPDQEMIESVIGYFITEDFAGYLDELAEDNKGYE